MTSGVEKAERESTLIDEQGLRNLVESLLFVADRPVELRQLEKILGVDSQSLEAAITVLGEECKRRGVRVQRTGNAIQMVTCPEAAPFVEKFLGMEGGGKLSVAALETLAIIAYQQPITRARIEAIRGVNSDHVVATLLARGLIAEAGRLETAGRPTLFVTTFEFLRHFGLQRLEDLPPLSRQDIF